MINGDTKILPFRPRKNRIDSPMSPDVFRMQVQQYLTNIIVGQNELQDAHHLFRASIGHIWPDQCEDIITLARMLGSSTQDFCTLMSNTKALPKNIVPLRYSLTTKLHYMNKQILDLIRLLTDFFLVCPTSLAQTDKQQLKVADQMKKLNQSCDELQCRVHALFNQIGENDFKLA